MAKKYLREYLGYAYRHYNGYNFEALQCFWPGKLDGRFPWQSGCSAAVREAQADLRD